MSEPTSMDAEIERRLRDRDAAHLRKRIDELDAEMRDLRNRRDAFARQLAVIEGTGAPPDEDAVL